MKTYKARCIYGCYEYYKTVTIDKRLKYCPYGQCGVRFAHYRTNDTTNVNCIELISYDSRVLILIKEQRSLIINGEHIDALATYSATTRRHVAAFLKEYAPHITYQDIKEALKIGGSVIEW